MSERRELFELLPPVLQRVRELGRICALEQPEFTAAAAACEKVCGELFPYICTAYGLERWEKMLAIVPAATDTVEQRRQLVLLRLSEQLPFTLRRLEEMLARVAPKEQYYLELLPGEYTLKVRISLIGKSYLRVLRDVLERVLPANIRLDMDLLYNRYGYLTDRTHGELAARRHSELREEVM